MELFKNDRPFFKGNLHCHTTESDGVKTPAEAIQTYKALGYDFLAITDHRRVTIPTARMQDGMLLLPGIELDYRLPEEVVHVVGFGMKESLLPKLNYELGVQDGIDAVRACGGRAIVAHPHWSLNSMATLAAIHGATAAEIYNSMSFLRPDSSNILDVVAAHGKLYPLVASDDTHAYGDEVGMSYTMVQAESLEVEAIQRAMDEGLFYASQGPEIHQITLSEGRIVVNCSPVSRIYFHSNLAWTPGRPVIGKGITEADYTLQAQRGERYIRCQVIDEAGRSAWSSYIKL